MSTRVATISMLWWRSRPPVVITGPQRAVVEAAGVERAGVGHCRVESRRRLVAGVEPAGWRDTAKQAAGAGAPFAMRLPKL